MMPLELGDDRRTAYLYFNSVFPIRLGAWDIVRLLLRCLSGINKDADFSVLQRYLAAKMEEETLLQQIRDLVVKDSIYQVRVESVYPREKDGGAFVKFSYSLPKIPYAEELATEEAEANDKKQEAEVLKILEKQAVRYWRRATRPMRSCSPSLFCRSTPSKQQAGNHWSYA